MKKFKQITEAYSDLFISDDMRLLLIDKLKNALKEEFNAWYGYIIIKDFLVGPNRTDIQKFYEDSAEDELTDHAYWLMKRINELGGTVEDISASPSSWLSADHPYVSPIWNYKNEGDSNSSCIIRIIDSLKQNITNEIGAIETYRDLVEFAKSAKDYTTEKKCKEILADEEEHLQALQEFLDDTIIIP